MERSPDHAFLTAAPPTVPGAPIAPAAPAVDRSPPAADETAAFSWPGLAAAVGQYALRLLAVGVGLAAVLYGYQLLLGSPDPVHYPSRYTFQFPARYFKYGAWFLTAAVLFGQRRREWAMAAVTLPCLHALYDTCPALVVYVVVLIPALWFLLGNESPPGRAASRRFWWGLAVGVVLLPKTIQVVFLDNAHDSWLDRNQTLFVGLFLRYAYYYYERRRALVPPGRFWEHVAYLLFIPQIGGMLNLPPSEMTARWGFGWHSLGRGFASVGWAAAKIPVVLWLENSILPTWSYGRGYPALRAAPWGEIWVCLLSGYLYWAVLVSAKFDLMAALFRFFGVNVDDNFRWPLLATSPVDLWRRWNIYNRRLLLKFVYFPLGGRERHVYRNILCTFLASAVLLHTGFLGSPWWGVNPFQLRDWLLYFGGQGVLVCATYWWLGRPWWTRLPAGARGPVRAVGWAFTLGSSAWLHALPLAAGNFVSGPGPVIDGLGQRTMLMLRALGWP